MCEYSQTHLFSQLGCLRDFGINIAFANNTSLTIRTIAMPGRDRTHIKLTVCSERLKIVKAV